jgi:hypothetical protein
VLTGHKALQTLDESLYANLDVTTSAVAWNIILLAQHPEQQELLRKEILRNANDLQAYVNRPGTFVAAAVVEAARLKPILGMSFKSRTACVHACPRADLALLQAFSNPESAIEDKIIDGYLIRRGVSELLRTLGAP